MKEYIAPKLELTAVSEQPLCASGGLEVEINAGDELDNF